MIKTLMIIVFLEAAALAETGVTTAFSNGEVSPDFYGRTDMVEYYRAAREIENMFVWPHGPVTKRSGTYYVNPILIRRVTPAVPGPPPTPGDYTFTMISQNTKIWYIPLFDAILQGLDAGAPAVDLGGGVTGLPMAAQPFIAGDTVRISNSVNYNAQYTVAAGGTSSQVRINRPYVAETFTGDEVIVRVEESLAPSSGRTDADSDANIYYGSNYIEVESEPNTYITKIEPDGTRDYTAVTFTTLPATPEAKTTMGVKVGAGDLNLYTRVQGIGITNFELAGGTEVWVAAVGGYDMDIDGNGNAYGITGDATTTQAAAADGATTQYTYMGQFLPGASGYRSIPWDVHVDDTLGLVMWGGRQEGFIAGDETLLYNLAVRTFDDSAGDQVQVGGTFAKEGSTDATYTIAVGFIASNGSNIYVLCSDIGGLKLWKYSWDGSKLSLVRSVVAPTTADGIYFDPWGNLGVVNANGANSDIIHFYDADLNFINKIEGMWPSMFGSWFGMGATWQSGNATFNGDIEIPGVPGADEVVRDIPGGGDEPPARLISFERGTAAGFVLQLGDMAMSVYRN